MEKFLVQVYRGMSLLMEQVNNLDKNDIWVGNIGAASQVPE
jgi:hypothetical protein